MARLIADAPEWPTLEELWALAPPTAPADDDRYEPDQAPSGIGMPAESDPSGWFALGLDAAATDPRALSDGQLIEAMAGFGRVGTWAQARQTRLVAEFDRRRPAPSARFSPDEIALALSVSRFAAIGLLDRSRRLDDTLHDTQAAFEAGEVDGFKVRLICEAVRYLDDAQAVWVQDQVLDLAPRQSVAQLRAALARAVIAVDAQGANARHRRARKGRRVGVGQEADGMTTVWASLSAQDAQQVFGTLTGLARSLGTMDPRGMDARRADLFVGLTTGEISIAFPTTESTTTESSAADDAETHAADSPTPAGSTASVRSDDWDDGDASDRGGRRDGGGDEAAVASGGGSAGPCPACVAQAWVAARPRLRPVNPAKPLVQVLMGHSTLRGVDHAPAELVGHGAICAEQARR